MELTKRVIAINTKYAVAKSTARLRTPQNLRGVKAPQYVERFFCLCPSRSYGGLGGLYLVQAASSDAVVLTRLVRLHELRTRMVALIKLSEEVQAMDSTERSITSQRQEILDLIDSIQAAAEVSEALATIFLNQETDYNKIVILSDLARKQSEIFKNARRVWEASL